MVKKNITIDDLAIMMKNSFDGQNEFLGKRFDGLEKDIISIKSDISILKKDVKEIKYDLKETTKQTDKLDVRMDCVENVLALKKN